MAVGASAFVQSGSTLAGAALARREAERTVVGMSAHAQLKGAKKANRRRPKKSRPSDINRKPPPYDVEPQFVEGREPEWSLLEEAPANFDAKAYVAKLVAEVEAEGGFFTPKDPKDMDAWVVAKMESEGTITSTAPASV